MRVLYLLRDRSNSCKAWHCTLRSYHGGQLNGVDVDVRTLMLMEKAKEIMGEICVFLCSQLSAESSISATDEIGKLCKDCEEYLVLWDAAISFVHEENPTVTVAVLRLKNVLTWQCVEASRFRI